MARRASRKPKRSLREYRRKRDFRATPEPAGVRNRADAGSRFVVQKHDARHLHFDFRLEHDGVLKSWAVPKGPSADPSMRRLAVQVEDHPLDYYDFEGVIPQGEYGGGTVMVWDVGRWTPIGDANEGLRAGHLKFALQGKRLKGGWTLIRMSGGKSSGTPSKPQWLLRKEDDRWARESAGDDDSGGLLTRYKTSVLTKRRMEEITRASGNAAVTSKSKLTPRSGRSRTVSSRRTSRVGRKSAAIEMRLTNPDRVVYPEIKFSKKDLVQYYADVAEWVLPHIAGRPISLLRCPEGQGKACFFQKHPRTGQPTALGSVRIREKSGADEYLVIDDAKGLLAAVQMGAIELHPWGSRAESLEFADYLVFDLDPGPGVSWEAVKDAARELRVELEQLDLAAFVRTSGGKGLHVVTPLMAGVNWDRAKDLAKSIAQVVAAREPRKYVAVMAKAKRSGRIFIDYLRNSRGATAIANYSTRARVGGPVATPLRWEELSKLRTPSQFNVTNIRQRLAKIKHDPWKEFALPEQPGAATRGGR